MSVGECKEALSISHGFPGWWGFYPTIISDSPEVLSVVCKEERSWIPFRKPGIIFGGTVCYLKANKSGETWIIYTNKYASDLNTVDAYDTKIRVVVRAVEQP